jgi:hypothetical protein
MALKMAEFRLCVVRCYRVVAGPSSLRRRAGGFSSSLERSDRRLLPPEVSVLRESPVRRVVLVVLDGLRPDAIPRFGLTNIGALARSGASTMLGRTVTPSVTACAMASLLTGATPERHGLQSEKFHIPRARGRIDHLPRLLAARGLPTAAFLRTMPMLFNAIAHRIAAHVGVEHSRFRGEDCLAILHQAKPTLAAQREGLILMHWPDADKVGHAEGWMSDGYASAARRLDAAVGELARCIDLRDPGTLLIALADHGGGGRCPITTTATIHSTRQSRSSSRAGRCGAANCRRGARCSTCRRRFAGRWVCRDPRALAAAR